MVPEEGGTIHLLHVQQIRRPNLIAYFLQLVRGCTWRQVGAAMNQSAEKLEAIRADIQRQRQHIKVVTSVAYSKSIEDFIIKKSRNVYADLIIVGKSACHASFPYLNTVVPSRIAQISGIPVLTAKPGSTDNETRIVVMPIDAGFPASKIAIIDALKRNMTQMQLVIFSQDKEKPSFPKQYIPGIFHKLKSMSAIPVKYVELHGTNKAKVLLNYCNSVNADMLIVNPGVETTVSRRVNRHLSDILPPTSRTMILAVR